MRRLAIFKSVKIQLPNDKWLGEWEVVGKNFVYASRTWDLGLVLENTSNTELAWPQYVYGYKANSKSAFLNRTTILLPSSFDNCDPRSIQDWPTYVKKYEDSTRASSRLLFSTIEQFYKNIKCHFLNKMGYEPMKNFRFLKDTNPDVVRDFNRAGNGAMFIAEGPICLVKAREHTCFVFGKIGLARKVNLPTVWGETHVDKKFLDKILEDARLDSILEEHSEKYHMGMAID